MSTRVIERCRTRTTCRLCSSDALELVLPLAPAPPPDHYVTRDSLDVSQETYPVDVMLCRTCGHAQLSVVVAPEFVYGGYIYETTTSPGLVDHFARYADAILARHPRPPGSLVMDVGSNDGTLLRQFALRGMRVLGIEPAASVAVKARAGGIETVEAFLDRRVAAELRSRWGPAAVVTANNVFANVDELDEFTAAIRDLLAPDGIFVMETSYLVDLIRNMVWDTIYHEHLSYFSVTPLIPFLARHGMQLVSAERVATKGGSLRVVARVASGGPVTSVAVAEMLAKEAAFGVTRPERFAAYREEIDDRRSRLVGLLASARAAGRTIDGYGASPTTTTLVYHYGIGGMLRWLLDDNPIKQGRYSPGLHIPVVPPTVLEGSPPDDVLIIAWRFADAIIAKHEAFRSRGGRFIVPLPDVRVT